VAEKLNSFVPPAQRGGEEPGKVTEMPEQKAA
jgi:hypothetical protein